MTEATGNSIDVQKQARKSGRRDFLKVGGVSVAATLAHAALPANARADAEPVDAVAGEYQGGAGDDADAEPG